MTNLRFFQIVVSEDRILQDISSQQEHVKERVHMCIQTYNLLGQGLSTEGMCTPGSTLRGPGRYAGTEHCHRSRVRVGQEQSCTDTLMTPHATPLLRVQLLITPTPSKGTLIKKGSAGCSLIKKFENPCVRERLIYSCKCSLYSMLRGIHFTE